MPDISDYLAELDGHCGNIIAGTYYLYISGTEKADNSNFSYNKIEYLNY